MADQSLLRTLGRLRRRMLVIGAGAALGWGAVAAAAWLLAGAWLDLLVELSPAQRLAAALSAGLVALAVLAWIVRRVAAGGAVQRLAGRLDALAQTNGQIRSAAELALGSDGSRAASFATSRAARPAPRPQLTSGLAALAVRRGALLAGGVSGGRVAPLGPLGIAAAAVAGGAALCAVLALFLPRLAETQWRRFLDPFGDHPPYSAVTFEISPGYARVVYGEGFEVRVTADKPLSSDVELVLVSRQDGRQPTMDAAHEPESIHHPLSTAHPAEQVLPMFPEAGGRWRATVSNVTQPLEYYVRSHRARSRRHAVEVILAPRFAGVRFRVAPPAYTHQKPWEGELPKGGLAGLPGTLVEVRARSNRPLRGGTIEVVAEGTSTHLAMQADPADGATAVGSFTIRGGGRIELRLEDIDGQLSTEVFRAPVMLLEDERPFVRLLQPPAVSFATPSAFLPVVISGEDDYGISRLQLFRSLNDSRYLPLDVTIAEPPPLRVYEIVRLPLAAYGLAAGDEIKLFARVEDNDPAARPPGESEGWRGGKGSESSVVLVRIISEEDFRRMREQRDAMELLQSKYRQAQRRMESVAEELESLRKKSDDAPADDAASQETQDELQRLVRRMQEEVDALRRLAESDLPLDLDRLLEQELARQSDQLQRLQKRAGALAQNKRLSNEELKQALQEMLDSLSQERERLDNEVMGPLEFLEAVQKLVQDEDRFVELYQRQRELAERLSPLKGRDREDDPSLKARIRDLEAEQARIRDDLARLLSDIEEHAGQLPDGDETDALRDSALEFVAAVRDSGATEAMVEAETGLSEFSGTRGHAGAKQAADILEKFLSQCKGFGQDGVARACLGRFSPGMAQSLQLTIGQLLAGAGLGGRGQGGGGGYSARRSTLQNVGLFGNDPLLDQQAAQRAGLRSDQRPRGELAPAAIRGEGRYGGTGYDSSGVSQAAGGAESIVPLRYRRKVGRYFQRIADEIGDE
ncbi:MAG: hypothetical protein WED34_22000 [Planctomycetales bacterium]